MDPYNPLYKDFVEGKIKDLDQCLNNQNQIYGANHWYPLIKDITPESLLFELSDQEIKDFTSGIIPNDIREKIEPILKDYKFVKTTHKSAHAFKLVDTFEEFENQMLDANVIMSFRRYKCRYLFFRKWTKINLECRIYVYKSQIKYLEIYRDANSEFKLDMFKDIFEFVKDQVIPKLTGLYDTFSVDTYFDYTKQTWNVIEINSPLWLKCGTHLIKYDWEKDRIHETEVPIYRFVNYGETVEVKYL